MASTVHASVAAVMHSAVSALSEDPAAIARLQLLPKNLDEWTNQTAHLARGLLTGPLRPNMERIGWDVDLLPPAPEAPAPSIERPRVHLTPPGHTPPTIAVTTTAGHPGRTAVATIPGAAWNGLDGHTLPLNPRTAVALRAALTGHSPDLHPADAARLSAIASTVPDPHVTLGGTTDQQRIEIRFDHTPARQAAVRSAQGTWDGQCWHFPAAHLDEVLDVATRLHLDVDPAVHDLAHQRRQPLRYDGTIDGLRGVPVTDLHAVASRQARGKTAALADRLAAYGIHSVYDLLTTIPARYLDRRTSAPLRDLPIGAEVGLLATVSSVGTYDRVRRLVRVAVTDPTGSLTATFFNAPWIPHRIHPGMEVAIHGRLDVYEARGQRALQMTNPVMDPVGSATAMVVPIYPQSPKNDLSTWDLHAAAMEAVDRLGDLQDPLSADLLSRHHLLDRAAAYRHVHRPEDPTLASRARDRLAFDELYRMQIALGLRRNAMATETGVRHRPTGALTEAFVQALDFDLTGAQQRAMTEILDDLRRPHPMNRLLQGDVGSGKTMVAALSLLAARESGFQGALMAPTEILASQLHAELAERLEGIQAADQTPIVVEFLGAKTRAKDRRRILAGLTAGSVDIVVGTHSLLNEEVAFADLGLVVIDEQHRFGVEQRAALRAKRLDGAPDMLLMTATPIPRTAALTAYGDLAVSVLDQLPPGRTPIETTWVASEPELDGPAHPVWDRLREEVDRGHQAYVVASLVEDNESQAAKSATEAYESLQHGPLSGLRLGLVHGKQPREEREAVMAAFKDGHLDVLVATTVIEVGVNVPNATGIVVLDPTRFGIAQLHQIRGRVGRGTAASFCVLYGQSTSADGAIRMNALCQSTDGFHLSEVDLNLRGAGSIFGSRQSGDTDLRVADLTRDRDLITIARREADLLLDRDPALARRPGLRGEVHADLGDEAAAWLAKT